jgi:glutamate-5-semialdehyde dehydrogenase
MSVAASNSKKKASRTNASKKNAAAASRPEATKLKKAANVSASAEKVDAVHAVALAARRAARRLMVLSEEQRNAALEAMAAALESASGELLRANAEDLKSASELQKSGEIAASTVERLKLNEAKLTEMAQQVRAVRALPDPLGRVLLATQLDDADPDPASAKTMKPARESHGLTMQRLSVPIGVLAVIFEARPDAVTQIASLALKSGNAVILKPGKEVEHTAAALVRVIRAAIASAGIEADTVSMVRGRAEAQTLLAEHKLVDLVIPRGARALVEYVQANTRIPVLGHAEGVCHIYVDRDADEAMALRVIEDAKLDYPAACNAVETVLVHESVAKKFVPRLVKRLHKRGVVVHACEPSREILLTAEFGEMPGIFDWHTEYGAPEISVGIVRSLDAAIAHIHAHGSSHTEAIITRDEAVAERFLHEVDAASVMLNASTRFADGFRYGFGAEVGVSTSKFHARGPVGLEGLTTYKYVLRGAGHIAGEYRGNSARAFTHRALKTIAPVAKKSVVRSSAKEEKAARNTPAKSRAVKSRAVKSTAVNNTSAKRAASKAGNRKTPGGSR